MSLAPKGKENVFQSHHFFPANMLNFGGCDRKQHANNGIQRSGFENCINLLILVLKRLVDSLIEIQS